MRVRGNVLFLFACLLAVPAVVPVARADFDEQISLQAESLELNNLIGEITVVGHGGGGFEVEVRARGRDATRENLTVETREGADAAVSIRFPREDRFVYPRLGANSKTRLDRNPGGDGFSGFLSSLFGGGGRVTVAGGGRGVELWADVTVRVPEGGSISIQHGVGTIAAEKLDGRVALHVRSGEVEARSVRGEVLIDTGSGKAVVEDVEGALTIDTGSGSVRVARVRGAEVGVDTGSGEVRLEDVDAGSLTIDTGSGSVRGESLGADEATIDTGSGSVSVGFVRIGDGDFLIDTGSGSIEVTFPADASARVDADTGAGRIRVDFPGAEIRRMEEDEAEVVIGAGNAHFVLDTGSGTIRIR